MSERLGLEIRHHTGFTYNGTAKFSYNEARMTPIIEPRQQVYRNHINVSPPTTLSSYVDFFNTVVTTFDVQEPHETLAVEAISIVESEAPVRSSAISWSDLKDDNLIDRFSDYLFVTRRTQLSEEVEALVSDFPASLDLHECAEAVGDLVREHVTYLPGATTVTSTAQEAWLHESGVCQDISHITIALLRSLGIPTRYVSGYLYPGEGDDVGVKVDGQSHAWVEYFSGEWTGIDPTNGVPETERHIIVGRGRDYDDVSPLKGIYQGPPSSSLGVVVEMSRTH